MPLFQSEFKYETVMKMTLICMNDTACGTHFHMNGFTLRLVLKQRHENLEMAYLSSCYECIILKYVCHDGPSWKINILAKIFSRNLH